MSFAPSTASTANRRSSDPHAPTLGTRSLMPDEDLLTLLRAEAAHPFSGWDFSHITRTDRMVEAPLPWSYASKILSRLSRVSSLLDMGTGGGEFLSMLLPLPKRTRATEGYAPNLAIARHRLEPLDVEVHQIADDLKLPFGEGEFELVINRHESYAPAEVRRVLAPGGEFATQQVGGRNDVELIERLGAPAYEWEHWNLAFAAQELERAGLRVIEHMEGLSVTRFFDAGAVVYYLKAIPWTVPDFSVERHFEALAGIHAQIKDQGYLDVTCHRFLLIAQKP